MSDNFNGDNAHLINCIEALLAMDADGILRPHGIGGHARGLLSAAAVRLAPTQGADAQQSAWQPIETAPKFGEPIDIWGRYGRTPDCVYGKPTYTGGLQWIHEAGYDSNGPVFEIIVDPTHWQPPPKPPADAAIESQRSEKSNG